MKINKFSMALITAASLLAVSPAVRAQDNNAGGAAPAERPRGMTADSMVERIDKAVTLTDAEKPKVKAAAEEQISAMKAARDESDQSARREKMKTAHETFNKKMKEILTPEQYTKFESMPRGGRRGGGGGN